MMKILFLAIILTLISALAALAYSGVIIDATTSLAPQPGQLVSSVGYELTLGKQINGDSLDSVMENGLVCYANSVDTARDSGFVGNDPLVVHALSRFDDADATNVIIPPESIKEIVKMARKPDYLGKLKIALVL